MQRKLAAIFSADIAGYTRLMRLDEEATLNTLNAHRRIVDGLVTAHRGRIFHTAGDSVVAEFPSAVEAIHCAVKIQQEIAERNLEVAPERRLEFRIGINIGDVMAEGENMFGDGVNVADRVQKIAKPGEICVSGNVFEQIQHKVHFGLESLGRHHVKNIAGPISVYRVSQDQQTGPFKSVISFFRVGRRSLSFSAIALIATLVLGLGAVWYSQQDASTRMASIAVLPFDNMASDQSMQYYGDGVAEDIIAMLSRVPDLAVVARNSSFAYKGRSIDVREVGRELGADFVLEGSVRRDQERIRIVAQLIDAATGKHVWAERYENVGTDPWVLQDEVTQKIVTSLAGENGRVRQIEYARAWGKDATSLGEYDYFLRSQEVFFRWTKEDNRRAEEILREGLIKFPNSALLRVTLAWTYNQRAFSFWSDDAAADYRKAGELAREALSMKSVPPQVKRSGYWVLANVELLGERDFDRALAHAEAARAVAPYDAYLLGDLSMVLTAVGKPDEALLWLEESRRRDPGLAILNWHWAWAYYVKGDYEKAIEAASRLDPSNLERYILPASSYVRLDRLEEARRAVAKILELDPGFSQQKVRDGYVYSDPSILDRQVSDLGKAGLPEK